MKIEIIYGFKNAYKAKGLTIVIDVLRAFTTACFVIGNNAKEIIAIANLKLAYQLKQQHPDWLLIGERMGVKQAGFDFGNSALEIESISFKNKTVILTTSLGTQAINLVSQASEIITGAFVNVQAVINYITKKCPQQVFLVCTDAEFKDDEDIMLAKYIKGQLINNPLDFNQIKNHLQNHPQLKQFLSHPLSPTYPQDFCLALELDRFNFVLKAEKNIDNLIIIKKCY